MGTLKDAHQEAEGYPSGRPCWARSRRAAVGGVGLGEGLGRGAEAGERAPGRQGCLTRGASLLYVEMRKFVPSSVLGLGLPP